VQETLFGDIRITVYLDEADAAELAFRQVIRALEFIRAHSPVWWRRTQQAIQTIRCVERGAGIWTEYRLLHIGIRKIKDLDRVLEAIVHDVTHWTLNEKYHLSYEGNEEAHELVCIRASNRFLQETGRDYRAPYPPKTRYWEVPQEERWW